MKKLTILLSILLISYITIGCQNIDKYKIETINTIDSKEVGIEENIKILALFENNLLYKKEIQSYSDTADDEYFIYDIVSKESKSIGIIKDINIDSGDFQIINNEYIYMSPGIYKNDKLVSQLTKFDINNTKQEILSEVSDTNPLIYFNKLNNKEFIMHGAKFNEKSNEYSYYIDTYNFENNIRNTIVKSNYNMNTQTGRVIVSVSVNDDKIYAYIMDQSENINKHLIEIFDENGKLNKVLELKKIDNYLIDSNGEVDAVFNLTAFKNYLHIYTLNRKSILFKYNNDNLEYLELGENNRMQLIDLYNDNLDNIQNNKVYFLDKTINTLYLLDLNTSKLDTLDISIEEGYIINDCVVNERGDVIVKCSKNESEYKYYFIEVE